MALPQDLALPEPKGQLATRLRRRRTPTAAFYFFTFWRRCFTGRLHDLSRSFFESLILILSCCGLSLDFTLSPWRAERMDLRAGPSRRCYSTSGGWRSVAGSGARKLSAWCLFAWA